MQPTNGLRKGFGCLIPPGGRNSLGRLHDLLKKLENASTRGRIRKPGVGNTLSAKVRGAIASYERGDLSAAIGQLKALLRRMRAQGRGKIDSRLADECVLFARELIRDLQEERDVACHAKSNTPGAEKLIFAVDDFSVVRQLTEAEKKNIQATARKREKDVTINMLVVELKPTSEIFAFTRAETIKDELVSKKSGDRTNSATLRWVGPIKSRPELEPFEEKCCHDVGAAGLFGVTLVWNLGRNHPNAKGETEAMMTFGTPEKPIATVLKFTADRPNCRAGSVTLEERVEVDLAVKFFQKDVGKEVLVSQEGKIKFITRVDGEEKQVLTENLNKDRSSVQGGQRLAAELKGGSQFLMLTDLTVAHSVRMEASAKKRAKCAGAVKIELGTFRLHDKIEGLNSEKDLKRK